MQDFPKDFKMPKDRPLWFIRRSYLPTIQKLDPEKDADVIVRIFAGLEFPWDTVRALEVALMRTFCSPSISKLLHRTREFEAQGQKRYDDTALLVAEFMQWGLEHPRAQQAIEQVNHIHGHFDIPNEDFLYVLSTFVLDPIRWVDQYGWRKTSEHERLALYHFFRKVGERMHIANIPDTFEKFKRWAQQYEQEHFHYSESNAQVADATVGVMRAWLPKPLQFAAKPAVRALLDQQMRDAFGYKPANWFWRGSLKGSMALRALFLKLFNTQKEPTFFTDKPNRSYPDGYEIEGIKPSYLKKEE